MKKYYNVMNGMDSMSRTVQKIMCGKAGSWIKPNISYDVECEFKGYVFLHPFGSKMIFVLLFYKEEYVEIGLYDTRISLQHTELIDYRTKEVVRGSNEYKFIITGFNNCKFVQISFDFGSENSSIFQEHENVKITIRTAPLSKHDEYRYRLKYVKVPIVKDDIIREFMEESLIQLWNNTTKSDGTGHFSDTSFMHDYYDPDQAYWIFDGKSIPRGSETWLKIGFWRYQCCSFDIGEIGQYAETWKLLCRFWKRVEDGKFNDKSDKKLVKRLKSLSSIIHCDSDSDDSSESSDSDSEDSSESSDSDDKSDNELEDSCKSSDDDEK
jgi:hypothetical protein